MTNGQKLLEQNFVDKEATAKENKTSETKEEVHHERKNEKIVCEKSEVPCKCGVCGSDLMIGGPIWNDKIHNINFVKALYDQTESEECAKMFGTTNRIKGVLGGIIDEEWLAHKPLSFDLSALCSNLKISNPTKNQLIAGFRSLDYMIT